MYITTVNKSFKNGSNGFLYVLYNPEMDESGEIKEFRSNRGSGHVVVLGGALWQDKEGRVVQCGLWDPQRVLKRRTLSVCDSESSLVQCRGWTGKGQTPR